VMYDFADDDDLVNFISLFVPRRLLASWFYGGRVCTKCVACPVLSAFQPLSLTHVYLPPVFVQVTAVRNVPVRLEGSNL
jgi:hypothetical protein